MREIAKSGIKIAKNVSKSAENVPKIAKMNKLINLTDTLGPMVYHETNSYICFMVGGQPHTAIIETNEHSKAETIVISGNKPGGPIYRTPHVAEAFQYIRRIS